MNASFKVELFELLIETQAEVDEMGLHRINQVILFENLLLTETSPLYDAIFEQIDSNEFEDLLEACDYELMDYFAIPTYNTMRSRRNGRNKNSGFMGRVLNQKSDERSIEFVIQDREVILRFDVDTTNVFNKLIECISEGKTVGIEEITNYLLQDLSTSIIKILRSFGVNIQSLKACFAEHRLDEYTDKNEQENVQDGTNKFVIPKELKEFVTDLNETLKNKVCDISGRDKECNTLWQTMQKQTKRNAILVGEPGVGKTSIVEKITYDIISGQCPEEFRDMHVLSLDVNSSIAGTMYRGQAEERYSKLTKFLGEVKNVILFIDEIHLIRGAGSTHEGEADLANSLKPILAGSNVRVIGATTMDEYEKYFSKDGAIKRRFRPIEVKEPKTDEVYPMLKKSIETLTKYHGVSVSEEMVKFIILNSSCFNYETRNPDRTKDLIDLSMVAAKQKGKNEVDKEAVLENFDYSLKMFSKMSKENKLSVAYHEAGHAIMTLCSEHLKNIRVKAVSIMPSENYLGLTVSERDDIYIEPTMEYYIDEIASDLAGRVAEKMFTNTISSGASSDLRKATRYAEGLVTEFGMSELGINRTYHEDLMSEKMTNTVNDQVDVIINKATERAEEVLTDNSSLLDALANKLLEQGIVGEEELSELLKEYQIKA